MTRLPPDEAARVAAAVTAAEAGTDAEILTVLAPRSDTYHDVALHYALLAVLLLLALVAAVPGHLADLPDRLLGGGWGAGLGTGALLTLQLVAATLVFLVARLLLSIPALRLALTPGATRARRVRRRAIEAFRIGAEHRTAARNGVLLYLSLAEHRAEIVADADIAARVDPDRWGEAMAALVEGLRDGRPGDALVDAIGRVGAILAEHVPRTGRDANELPDRLIQL